MEHWLLPEVIPPAVLYPLVQGGRRGGSIYGTGRVIFSLQEGHGSSRHPHNQLKSTSKQGWDQEPGIQESRRGQTFPHYSPGQSEVNQIGHIQPSDEE